MADAKGLVNSQGQPLIPEPKLIVLKSEQPINQQFVQQMSKVTGCTVLSLPMHVEFVKGRVAASTMSQIHNAIHTVMDLPQIALSRQELDVVQKALTYIIRSMHLDRNAIEGRLEQKISEVLK